MLLKWILLFSISFSTFGYNLTQDFVNGFYWASLPVNFVVVESDPSRKALLTELAEDAMEEWERRTGLSLWDLSEGKSNNIIRWSNSFSKRTGMDPNSVLAVAIRYTNGPYFAKSEIVINGGHSSFNTPWSQVNKMNLGTTIVHELGHTMGLDHSDNMMAVMAPTLQYPYNGLHSDDVAGMSDAHDQTQHRQVTKFISPLAYTKETESSQALSCGTVSMGPTSVASHSGFSLGIGLLIGLVGRIRKWFKSLF